MKKIVLISLSVWAVALSFAQTNFSIKWPDEGFYTTNGTYFVPLDTVVRFNVLSESTPNDCRWELTGATPDVVESREASVVYSAEGNYDVSVEATVGDEREKILVEDGLQAGGAQFVWNISPIETARLETISLAWYGFYGGTNWLGMRKFAEFFHSPMQPAFVDSVAVRFGSTDVATADAELTLSIARADENGMPGEIVGSATLMASSINKTVGAPTFFRFAQPVMVDGSFFVVVEGFPNANGDGIAIQCVRRKVGEACTAYHLLADEDEHYQPTGTFSWYQNIDDPTSLAICPWVRFASHSSIVSLHDGTMAKCSFDGRSFHLVDGVGRMEIYNTTGTVMLAVDNPPAEVSIAALPAGVYLVRVDGTTMKIRR